MLRNTPCLRRCPGGATNWGVPVVGATAGHVDLEAWGTALSARSTRAPAPRALFGFGGPKKPTFDEFSELEGALREYLSTLGDVEAADGPLAYSALRENGRTDLVEGVMKHGGYVKVMTQP